MDWPDLHEGRFGEPYTGAPLGRLEGVWTGHAADTALRANAASGGSVTALLCHALEAGLVDGACVTFLEGTAPRTVIATTREEVIAAGGSVYLSAPALSVLREARRFRGRLAFVGLPCHIATLSKAVRCGLVKPDKFPLTIALVCGRTGTLDLHRAFLRRAGADPARLAALKFRGDGWPGTFRYTMDDGTRRAFPFPDPVYMSFWKFYQHQPRYCLLCSDPLGALADITAGDAWLPEYGGDREGRSILMARTPAGAALLAAAREAGALDLAPLAPERVLVAQRQQVFSKFTNQRTMRTVLGAVAALCRWPMPDDRGTDRWPKTGLKGLAYAVFQVVNALGSEFPRLRWLPRLMPLRTLSKLLARRRIHARAARNPKEG
jgi:coenzyme F420 hydrogenase subunit beta